MTASLIDANVLLDILTEDPAWADWSTDALADAIDAGPIHINPIIYAEVSARFISIEVLDEVLPPDEFLRSPLPWPAAFLAQKAHLDYRRRGGARTTTLPDFYIGAHAAIMDMRLVTRDASRFTTYFPTVDLLSP